ncbi:hypothetical protein CLI64_11765 [Nostoc sp. CENA543]|uniref:hypothetical protein n=1 Tax=Nostoc sp. CENA543 TaxID=1869241 RepID=UPI000CA2C4EF|nr:hypothetical protein [Nostoc sp. CENA543]AUT01019.1 hypothetical protein CLI64_11765 [Nostoc sp. CENA543]
MSQSIPPTCANLAIALLTHYSFDLSGHSAGELVHRWQKQYPPDWLHLAVIEALYQGRYKGISVQQILAFWLRRGQAIYHFNMEFERLICSQFPLSLTATTTNTLNFQQPPTSSNHFLPPAVTSALPEENDNGIHSMNGKATETVKSAEIPTPPKQLAASSLGVVTEDIEQKSNLVEINSQQSKNLTIALNHPPIGQFTPIKSDRSESFTSKLKAISGEQLSSA